MKPEHYTLLQSKSKPITDCFTLAGSYKERKNIKNSYKNKCLIRISLFECNKNKNMWR